MSGVVYENSISTDKLPKLIIYPRGADYKDSQSQRQYYVYYPSSVQLSTSRECQASTLSGSIPDVGDLFPEMGSRVQFIAEDGVCVFAGNLFKADVDRWGAVSFTAYDQLRYLRGDFTRNIAHWEVSDVVKAVLDTYKIPTGVIEKTNIQMIARKMVKNQCCLDVISSMIDYAEVQSARLRVAMEAIEGEGGEVWVFFYDPYEGACFMKAENVYDLVMKRHNLGDAIIGEHSLATDFSLSVSIDDLFNSVAIYRQNDEYSGAIGAIAESHNSINAYGPLRYFEQISDNMCNNKEQLTRRARLVLAWKNHVQRSFTVNAIGVPGIRAGMFIYINFSSFEKTLGPISKSKKAFISECSHTWENNTHTMDLTLQVATKDEPDNSVEVYWSGDKKKGK